MIDDLVFDAWAVELEQLQKDHPEIASKCVYHDEFKDFDSSSGFQLPLTCPKIIATATQLLRYTKEITNKGIK